MFSVLERIALYPQINLTGRHSDNNSVLLLLRMDLINLKLKSDIACPAANAFSYMRRGGNMSDLTLRQQNGILFIMVPNDVADRAGWTPGIRFNVTVEGEIVSLTPASRLPRGRKTLAHLLSGIDQSEFSYLN
ncbi:AbrB/MazE/SpoVT family DNA-binding domain-containing protein [Pantoea dispersa]|nr:hypothetical protein [Pantoea dispersa]